MAQIDSELCETMEEAAMLRDQLVLEHRGAKTTHRLNFPDQREGNTPAVRARSSQLHLKRTPLAINHSNGCMPSALLLCRRRCEEQQRVGSSGWTSPAGMAAWRECAGMVLTPTRVLRMAQATAATPTPKPKTPRGSKKAETPLSKMARLTPLASAPKRPKVMSDSPMSPQIIHWPLPKGAKFEEDEERLPPPSTRGLFGYLMFLLWALPALFVVVLACIVGGVPGFPASVVRCLTAPRTPPGKIGEK